MPTIESNIPDFTDHETGLIRSILDERYGQGKLVLSPVDVELQLLGSDSELTLCPAIYWENKNYKFILSKVMENSTTEERLYQSQFFCSVRQHYGGEPNQYKDLGECVVNLLKLQEKYQQGLTEKPISIDLLGLAKNNSITSE